MFDAKKEKRKLKKILGGIPKDKISLVEGLVADASFMVEQLEMLRIHIEEHGWSEEYRNGANQYGKKQSVEADTYLKLQKSYAAVIRQLTDFLPDKKDDDLKLAGNTLGNFVAKGKKVELR